MLKLWLPPKVWLQGSQSTSTSGWRNRNDHTCEICCWLAHSMRWVLITTLGNPVDPLVSRYLAWVVGRIAANASITAGDSAAASSQVNGWAPGSSCALAPNTMGALLPQVARAGPYTLA